MKRSGIEGARHWVAGLIAAIAIGTCTPALAQEGRWLKVESPQFVAYGEDGEAKLVAAVRDLEALDGLLRRMTQTNAPPASVRLEVYLFDNRSGIERVWKGSSSSIGGFYTAQLDLIAAFNNYGEEEASGRAADARPTSYAKTVLYHEYAHHFMHQYFSNAYPGWYTEGFADYVGNIRFTRGRIEVGRVDPIRASWLLGGRWMSLERLLKGRDATFDSDDVAQFYAQSWLAVHYLINTPERKEGFRRYLVALRDGGDAITAFEPAFGVSVATFEQELRRYQRSTLNAFALTRPAEVDRLPITVSQLPPSANDTLLVSARVRFRPDAESLAAIRAIAARYPDEAMVRRTLAMAEIKAGDPAAALAPLDAVLAVNPEDAEALYLKGLALIVQSRKPGADAAALLGQARPLLGRANRLAPNNPHTLYRYSQAAGARADATAESTLNVLLLAHQLAPQVDEIRLNAAGALLAYQRYDEAVGLLRPLAYDAHQGATSVTAQSMLEAARARRPWTPSEDPDDK